VLALRLPTGFLGAEDVWVLICTCRSGLRVLYQAIDVSGTMSGFLCCALHVVWRLHSGGRR
jgi:hypothetical protein